METTPTPITTVVTRNIKLGLADSGISKNALAGKAGLSSTTLDRKLSHRPEMFTVQEMGKIAAALGLQFQDLFTDAA